MRRRDLFKAAGALTVSAAMPAPLPIITIELSIPMPPPPAYDMDQEAIDRLFDRLSYALVLPVSVLRGDYVRRVIDPVIELPIAVRERLLSGAVST